MPSLVTVSTQTPYGLVASRPRPGVDDRGGLAVGAGGQHPPVAGRAQHAVAQEGHAGLAARRTRSRNGVASRVASVAQQPFQAAASAFSKAAMYRSSSARARGSVGSSRSSAPGASFVQPGTGALQRALDRDRGGAEHDRDLGGGERQHVAQDEDRALPGGRYCRLAMSASRSHSRAATTAAGSAESGSHQRVRHRLQPARPSDPAIFRATRPDPVPDRPGPRAAPADPALGQRGQADVGGDLVEPGPHRGPALEAAVGAPRPQVRLLDQVLGVVRRADHAVAVRQQLPPERLGVLGEPVLLARRAIRLVAQGSRASLPTVASRFQFRERLRAVGQVVHGGPAGGEHAGGDERRTARP